MRAGFERFLAILIRLELQEMRSYVRTVAKALERECDDFEAKLSKQMEQYGADPQPFWTEIQQDRAYAFGEKYPALAMQNLFVSLYSFLEYHLFQVCDHLHKERGYQISPQDLRGNGIEQARLYLTKVCGVKFPSGSKSWQEIQHYRKLRNLIVHNSGRLRADNDKFIQDYVGTKNTLEFDHCSQLRVSKEYCLECIDTIETFLKELTNALKG